MNMSAICFGSESMFNGIFNQGLNHHWRKSIVLQFERAIDRKLKRSLHTRLHNIEIGLGIIRFVDPIYYFSRICGRAARKYLIRCVCTVDACSGSVSISCPISAKVLNRKWFNLCFVNSPFLLLEHDVQALSILARTEAASAAISAPFPPAKLLIKNEENTRRGKII